MTDETAEHLDLDARTIPGDRRAGGAEFGGVEGLVDGERRLTLRPARRGGR